MTSTYSLHFPRFLCGSILLLTVVVAWPGAIYGLDFLRGSRPNVIVFLVDDLGYGDVGCYGHPKNRTPHVDRLAAQGLRFTDFHSNGAMCTPTRAALLTGRYQNRFGKMFEGPLSARGNPYEGLPLETVTVADALKGVGYHTAMFGKWHLGFRAPFLPTRQGFDEYRGLTSGDGDHHSQVNRSGEKDWWRNEEIEMEEGYTTELITRHSVDFIERHTDAPFFLYVARLAIHFPWQGPDEKAHRVEGTGYWNLTKLGPHEPGQVAPVVQAMVESIDRSLGAIVAALKRLRLEKRTLVIFTSDNGGYLHYGDRFHGEISSNGPLRGQKSDLFEGGHRVPTIAWWPGRIQPGRVSDELVMSVDLMPTFLELAGSVWPAGAPQDGVSLLDHLVSGTSLPERTAFWRVGRRGAVRRGSWKLVLQRDRAMLFDLSQDLGEKTDLAATQASRVADLRQRYTLWEKEVTGKR